MTASLLVARCAASLLLASSSFAVNVNPANTLFGHAIKNGPLQPNTETTTFEHNCTFAPCTITQIHVPSIYPTAGCPWDWENGLLRVYVDGALTIQLRLLEIALVGSKGAVGHNAPADGSPFGNDLFGKTAVSGGVYTTMRIPFQSSIRTTIQAPASCNATSIYWFVIRGVEGMPVVLGGELTLPDQATLAVYRQTNVTLQPEQFLTVASAPAGTAGALLSLMFDAASGDYNYLEACVRFYPNGASTPLYLSSGTEDYFLSASYYDEGMFKTSQSGVTYQAGPGDVAMYKVHGSRDYLLWQDGMNMTWRDNENSCPSRWPWTSAPSPSATRPVGVTTGPDTVSTLVFMYTWPSNEAVLTYGGAAAAAGQSRGVYTGRLRRISALAQARLLTAQQEATAVAAVLSGDTQITALLDAYEGRNDEVVGRLVAQWADANYGSAK